MKAFLISYLLLISGSISDDISISYFASTRGNTIEFTILNTQLKYSDSKKTVQKTLSKKELKKIKKLLDKIELQSIHTLEPPSTKSHFDGALAASISIQCNDENYESSTFDHGNPPKELKKFIDYLLELIYTDSN